MLIRPTSFLRSIATLPHSRHHAKRSQKRTMTTVVESRPLMRL
jgi:hypothetical protein